MSQQNSPSNLAMPFLIPLRDQKRLRTPFCSILCYHFVGETHRYLINNTVFYIYIHIYNFHIGMFLNFIKKNVLI